MKRKKDHSSVLGSFAWTGPNGYSGTGYPMIFNSADVAEDHGFKPSSYSRKEHDKY